MFSLNSRTTLIQQELQKQPYLAAFLCKVFVFKYGMTDFYNTILNNIKIEYPQLRSINEEIDEESDKKILVKIGCNWLSSKELCDIWNKMSKGKYTWNNIRIVWNENHGPIDYYVIINGSEEVVDMKKTILFIMEPHWSVPNPERFLRYISHEVGYNNNEWHLSKTYDQLLVEEIKKTDFEIPTISTVLSKKYHDIGQIKRIDFAKFLDNKENLELHMYGDNFFKYKNYKGSLPYHQKDNALMPYKYTFAAENHDIHNYYTEKIIDGILAECLIFYWGCPNIINYIDRRAFVQLNLNNFELDYRCILNAIHENLWEKQLPYIKEAKRKILTELQFFPRLERIISEIENND